MSDDANEAMAFRVKPGLRDGFELGPFVTPRQEISWLSSSSIMADLHALAGAIAASSIPPDVIFGKERG